MGEGKCEEFPPLDPSNKYIISTRIRCGRTLKGYPFNPLLTGDDYLIMQEKVKRALGSFKDGDLKGTYYPLEGMTKKVQDQLVAGKRCEVFEPFNFFRSLLVQGRRQTLAARSGL